MDIDKIRKDIAEHNRLKDEELANLRERVKELEEIISNNHIDIGRTGNVESN